MFQGETVYVEDKVKTGENDYREPVYEAVERPVGGVLVAVGSTSNLADSNRPEGVAVAYTLYFPKTFSGRLRGKRVKVYGEWFDVVGDPRPWASPPPPTGWHMAVEVSATYG